MSSSSRDHVVTVVVDTTDTASGKLERLEVEVSLDNTTTVGNVVDDLVEALEGMGQRLLCKTDSIVLIWYDAGDYKGVLPPLGKGDNTSAQKLREAYRKTSIDLLSDVQTVAFSYQHDTDAVLLDTPQIQDCFTKADGQRGTPSPRYVLVVPGIPLKESPPTPPLSSTDGSSQPIQTSSLLPSGKSARVPTPPTASEPPARASTEMTEEEQKAWIHSQMLPRPLSSFKNYLREKHWNAVPPSADDGGNSQARAARLMVEEAIQRELQGSALMAVFPNTVDPAEGAAARATWLQQCAQEAALYEQETQRLETLMAQKIAWREATTRKLRSEVASLEDDAQASRRYLEHADILRIRLAELRRESAELQQEETDLLATLRAQRSATPPLSARKPVEDPPSTETPSPAPRPPTSQATSRTWQPLTAVGGGADGDESPCAPVQPPPAHQATLTSAATTAVEQPDTTELPDVSTIRRSRAAVEGNADDTLDAEQPAGEGGPATPSLRGQNDPTVTQLSFNTSGLAPPPHHREEDDNGERTFFFSPALRASVEDAIARRSTGRSSAPRTPSSIRVMGIRKEVDLRLDHRPSTEYRRGWNGHEGLSLSERLRMATADVSRHVENRRFTDASPLTDHTKDDDKEAERLRLMRTIQDLRRRIEEERRARLHASY